MNLNRQMSGSQAAAQVQADDSSAIDFKTMLAKERVRATQTLSLKPTTSLNVFNMLQDMRHLVILDLREEAEFAESHIRKSINVTVDTWKDQLIAAMLQYNDARFRSNYREDDLKRVLFVLPDNSESNRLSQAISGAIGEANERVVSSSG